MPIAEKKGRSQSAPGCLLSLRRVIPFIKQFAQLFHHLVPYHISRATKIAGDVKGFESLDGKSCFCHKWPSPEPATKGTSCQHHLCHSRPITIPSPEVWHIPGQRPDLISAATFSTAPAKGKGAGLSPRCCPRRVCPFSAEQPSQMSIRAGFDCCQSSSVLLMDSAALCCACSQQQYSRLLLN